MFDVALTSTMRNLNVSEETYKEWAKEVTLGFQNDNFMALKLKTLPSDAAHRIIVDGRTLLDVLQQQFSVTETLVQRTTQLEGIILKMNTTIEQMNKRQAFLTEKLLEFIIANQNGRVIPQVPEVSI